MATFFDCHDYQIALASLAAFFLLHLLRLSRRTPGSAPTRWPVIGMMPTVVRNISRIHDYITQVLNEFGGTFTFRGPTFARMDMLFTSDPANIHHIFVRKFHNYPKGPDFRAIFDVLGDGIFSSDSALWELHRRATLSLLNDDKFYALLEKTVWDKVRTGLGPVLDHFSRSGTEFDLQDVLQRFSFDNICRFFLDHDPGSLSVDLPDVPCERALGDALEPLFYRHIVPKPIWKLQKWLVIGQERKLIESWKAFDDFIYKHIDTSSSHEGLNVFASFVKAYNEGREKGLCSSGNLRGFLRDTFLGLLFAGRDSLSVSLTWFFWLISRNPQVEEKIREEMEEILKIKKGGEWRFFEMEECKGLVYLHAALCETLRLYPPIGLELKYAAEEDFLPSGHRVRPGTRVVVSFYSTGRLGSVWGEDCGEFRPERWLVEPGRVRNEPPARFPAFNVGPRSCPGKKMSFLEMKMVAAFMVHHFDVRAVAGQVVAPRNAIMLKARNGLRVRLTGKYRQ
ncbi:cytochrome P450- family 96- subfamily A-polypeptide 10 [Striga hermonthica]|uniref:Cytochrome P450- family 96- subfamily A-polypeptide 10 n=1 Tax=Striga hermonthica TaxID=68872 RepID=A0A9N7NPZ7_STRHE|nr:cytochrome P450- family 96- subfamily A-polypeptide 10 [Striga hermonthica]